MKDRKYFFYIILLAILLVTVIVTRSKQFDWTITLEHHDKNPYGTYVLHQLMPESFGNHPVRIFYKTFYELYDSMFENQNWIVLASSWMSDESDTRALLKFIHDGGHAIISTERLGMALTDTLGIRIHDNLNYGDLSGKNDSIFLYFTGMSMDHSRKYYYASKNIHHYFKFTESIKKSGIKTNATVIARDSGAHPVSIQINHGTGTLILNCTPLAFTNIYLLSDNHEEFVAGHFNYLPTKPVYRSEYYQVGRMEAASPLRFILSSEPLRWAYCITIGSLILFMLFESKRRQRIIPVIKPLTNTTLDFISTISDLYFHRLDHKNIADRKIHLLMEQIRNHFYINTTHLDGEFIKNLSSKSGASMTTTGQMINWIQLISPKPKITQEDLVNLNNFIEKFWAKA